LARADDLPSPCLQNIPAVPSALQLGAEVRSFLDKHFSLASFQPQSKLEIEMHIFTGESQTSSASTRLSWGW